jgi:RNA polymerase sigma factor (sigma-70 family)
MERRYHPNHSVSQLLERQQEEALMERVERALHGIAAHWLRKFSVVDLEPEDVVAEVYLRLREGLLNSFLRRREAAELEGPDRYDFYAYFSAVARTYVIDHVRAGSAGTRGGGAPHVELEADLVGDSDPATTPFGLDFKRVMNELRQQFPREAEAFNLRLCGYSIEEIATALATSRATINRDLREMRLRLSDRLGAPPLSGA